MLSMPSMSGMAIHRQVGEGIDLDQQVWKYQMPHFNECRAGKDALEERGARGIDLVLAGDVGDVDHELVDVVHAAARCLDQSGDAAQHGERLLLHAGATLGAL